MISAHGHYDQKSLDAWPPVGWAGRVISLLALWLCWGSSFPAMRVMVAALPPLTASGAVFLTAGAALAATRPRALRATARQAATAAGIGVCLLGAQGVVALAVRHVYASTAALLVAAVPLWVAFFRTFLGERPTRWGAARLLLGFAGVAAVMATGPVGWSPWAPAVVAAAVVWAAGTLWASRSPYVPGPRTATAVQLVTGGALLLLAGALLGERATPAPPTSWLAFGYLVLVDSLAGFALYNRLLRTTSVAVVGTYAYAVPLVAYLLGVTALGEPFRPWVLPAAAAILTAVAGEVGAARTAMP